MLFIGLTAWESSLTEQARKSEEMQIGTLSESLHDIQLEVGQSVNVKPPLKQGQEAQQRRSI